MILRGRSLILASLLATATIGCGDDILRPVDVAGSYTLASIDGDPPPVEVLQTDNGLTFATAGSLTLTADGDYSLLIQFETQPGGGGDIVLQTAFNDAGGFELGEDDRIVFFSSISQGNRVGRATGSRVTLSIEVPTAEKEIEVSLTR